MKNVCIFQYNLQSCVFYEYRYILYNSSGLLLTLLAFPDIFGIRSTAVYFSYISIPSNPLMLFVIIAELISAKEIHIIFWYYSTNSYLEK